MDQSTDEEYFYKVDNMILSSSHHVRNVFKIRWKDENGEDWVDDQSYIRNFLEGPGEPAFTRALPYQKLKLTASCSVEDWDIPLLYLIFQNFGSKKKYWKENEAVRKLKNVRNDLAHRTSKAFSQSEYNEKLETFAECLTCLGMGQSEIEKLIQKANVTSPLKAYEHVKVLFEEAEKLMTDGNFEAALERYSEAIVTPNLLPVNLGETYERRADCYLKGRKSLVIHDENCDRALSDVDKALELNSSSWTANYLAAKCHRIKNNILEAMKFYETALSISPAQKQVQNDLETCRVLVGVQPKYVDLRPRLTKVVEQGNLEDSLWRGHQYRYGIKVDQDYTKAVAFYTKADKQGSIEASFHLAECCYFGHGVQQDVKKAFEIFKRVAETETSAKKKAKMQNKRTVVGEAQYATGFCYEHGTGVENDNEKAVEWYEKAMGNGVGKAANNLGILYCNGVGVKKDEKVAEDCWEKGVELKDENSAECLVGYYCDQLEPEMASRFFEVGRELKNQRLTLLSDEEFNRKIELVRAEREKLITTVTEFEKRHHLKSSGFTCKHRVNRMETHLKPVITLANEAQVNTVSPKPCENWEDSYQPLTAKIVTELNKMKKEGSQDAHLILELTVNNNELNYIMENTKEFFRACKLKLMRLLYNCATTAFHFVVFKSDEDKQNLEKIVLELFEERQKHSKEDQMKIRFCYLRFNLWKLLTSAQDEFALGVLKEGLSQYPDNHLYHELLLLVFGYRSMWSEGIAFSDEALIRFPDNAEIMYYRAAHLRYKEGDNLAVIEAYKKFVNNAPLEHRKVPEAYYQISYGYIQEFKKNGDKSIIELIESNLQKGQESENVQLPCYLPYEESDAKLNVTRFLEKRLKKKRQPKLESGANEEKVCVVDKSESLQSSTRKKHIKDHRKIINQSKEVLGPIPKLQQFLPKKMSSVKPITLDEMKCTKDTVFENKVIDLTIIDDPFPQNKSIYLVVEDENRDTAPLYLYNVDVNQDYLEEFQPGCRIGIVNPYMWVDDQTKLCGLRIDEPLCIVHLEKVETMCRFCGKENAGLRCSLCKRPYCSKECRDLDWKKLSHKLICSTSMD